MLQISGHHLTYNITYNGPYISATPMFIGTEPPDYYSIGTDLTATEETVGGGHDQRCHHLFCGSPLQLLQQHDEHDDRSRRQQRHAPRAPGDPTRRGFRHRRQPSGGLGHRQRGTALGHVLRRGHGVTNSGDGNFPFINTNPTYPTGTTGRGVLYSSLSAAEQAEVLTMIDAWVTTQASDISASLLADYESPAALAQTYVGYQVGAGSADGGTTRCNFDALINEEKTPINSQHSYLRVDGPRVWIEMVVQAAVAFRNQNFVHYHSLWRDKLADYGNEFGGYLDTTSTATSYTRPTITTQPTSVTGTSATFAVAATGTGTLTYQWYNGSGAISGATSTSYSTATAGSYYVTVTNAYGATTSDAVTLALSASSHPAFFDGEVALSNGVYYLVFPNGNLFGYYAYLSDSAYIYHYDLGYEYVFDAADGNDGVYLYDFASSDFFYTSPVFPFPYLYDFNLGTVLYYFPDATNSGHYTSSPRYFYNFSTGAIITK